MFHDAIEHQDAELAKACADLLVQRFETAQEVGEDRAFLLELDLESFVSILQSDKLNIIHENVLTVMVKDYFATRINAKPVKELPPEKALKPELWALLDDTEKAARKAQYDARQKTLQDEIAAKRDEQSTKYQLMDTAQRIQFVLDLKQEERNKDIENMLRLKPLSDADKIEIFKAIRWTFITHEELLKLSMDPDFALAKSMIM